MDGGAVAAVIGALGGVLMAAAQIIKALRSTPSGAKGPSDGLGLLDGAERLMKMYQAALDDIRKEVVDLRADVDKLESQLDDVNRRLVYYRLGVGILISQLRRLGHTPEWEPTD